jgi:EmrB/QacA subfamily drug resistance transporter
MDNPNPQGSAVPNRGAILFITTLGSFLTPFMSSALNLALPRIGIEFNVDAIVLGWIVTSYLLAAVVFLVPLGRIADIYGRIKAFKYGVMFYSLSSFLCFLAPSASWMIFFRVLQGMSGGVMSVTAVAILISFYPAAERGRVIGINVAAVYTGLSIGPVLGGVLTQVWNWRSIFLVNVLIGAIVTIVSLLRLPGEKAEAGKIKFDFLGSIVFGISMVALIIGLSFLPLLRGGFLILLGMLGMVYFFYYESKSENPVLDLALFRNNRVFIFSNLAALINYAATSAIGFLLSLYLQYIKSLPPQTAGLVLLSQPVMQAVFSPLAGRLSDRIEPRIVASSGMIINVIGLFAFIFLGKNMPFVFIVANLALMGFGFALFSAPNTNAVISAVDRKNYGVASATLSTMRGSGQMLSMGITMMILALVVGRVRITPDYYPRFLTAGRISFLVFSLLSTVGVGASLYRGKLRQRGR